MLQFLNKHRLKILLFLLLTILSFWYNPWQKKLYSRTDFDLIEAKSRTALMCAIGVGVIIAIVIALKGVRNVKEVLSVLVGVGCLAFGGYLLFQTLFLSGSFVLNRISGSERLEKKYSTITLRETEQSILVLYDLKNKKPQLFEKITGIDKLNDRGAGDTITVSFRMGLLGIPFDPEVK